LGNLPVTRDNVRQAIADLLGLRLGLNFTQGADIDSAKVYGMGLSLGAIEMTGFLAMTNMPGLDTTLGTPGLDSMFKVGASVLASPGGGLANLLVESPAFGPLVQAGILGAAGSALSGEFNAFLAAPVMECVSYLPSQDAYGSCGFQVFSAMLQQTEQLSKLAEIKGLVGQFVFAAQTVTDAGDPSNYAALLHSLGTPVLVTEVIGDGEDNMADQVISNQTVNSPIGGTEPLIRALGLAGAASSISGSMTGELDENGLPAQFSGVVRFTKGHHSSLINPTANSASTDPQIAGRVTLEMQSQAVSFIASDGRAILVNDAELIQGVD